MNEFWNTLKSLFDMHSELDMEAAAANIRKNVDFKGMNIYILACAITIASLGLNVNSTAVIIGAMLISPLMGPIIGFGLSVGTDDIQLMKTSLKNLGIMMAISICASTIFFAISPLDMQHPSELLARTNPTIYDVLIALVGGIAGALETSRKEKGTVISGVAIATALMPPLCTVGYGISNLDLKIAGGAFYLFFINCVFVALATFFVVKYLRFPKVSHIDKARESKARIWASILLVVLIIPSVLSAISVIRENNFNTNVESLVKNSKQLIEGSVIYDYKTDPHSKPASATFYIAGRKLDDGQKESIYSLAETEYGISRHQIMFESALISKDDGELQKQVYSDLMSDIRQLKEQLSRYESAELPYQQIGNEVKALYPAVGELTLARGKDAVYAITCCPDSVAAAGKENLGRWLKVRLNCDNVVVINTENTER